MNENKKGTKVNERNTVVTFSAFAVRVEVGDGGRRDVLEAEQAGADETLAFGQPHYLHLGKLGHVLVERRLDVT